MASLRYNSSSGLFGWIGTHEEREPAELAGFDWDYNFRIWTTKDPIRAFAVLDQASQVAPAAASRLATIGRNVVDSLADAPPVGAPAIPAPAGLAYDPYQVAGILYAARLPVHLFGDEQGLGKTIQAIGLANYKRHKRLLIVCPANLRINWQRELDRWHVQNPGVLVLDTKADAEQARGDYRTVVVSYNLVAAEEVLSALEFETFDHLIIDEAHYLKNEDAKRTKSLFGTSRAPGLSFLAPVVSLLSGTPIPNNALEFYWLLRRAAPRVLAGMSFNAFLGRYQTFFNGERGLVITGSKNERELYVRLRDGFMVRRLKADVLKDLPEKRYQLVVFPQDAETARVIEKERPFSADEIREHGIPAGSSLPEIRREMGIAKVKQAAAYLKDQLDGGAAKIVVGAWHREVVEALAAALEAYSPAVVYGGMTSKAKQANVDAFTGDPKCRLIIGNLLAAGVGLNLQIAHDVYRVESSWVPGDNDQFDDRVHRRGQVRGVLVRALVVEGSLDAKILGRAATKAEGIGAVLDGRSLLADDDL